jgi:hypothetical protein
MEEWVVCTASACVMSVTEQALLCGMPLRHVSCAYCPCWSGLCYFEDNLLFISPGWVWPWSSGLSVCVVSSPMRALTTAPRWGESTSQVTSNLALPLCGPEFPHMRMSPLKAPPALPRGFTFLVPLPHPCIHSSIPFMSIYWARTIYQRPISPWNGPGLVLGRVGGHFVTVTYDGLP